jgi:hypothetical protein
MSTFRPHIGHLPIILTPPTELEGRAYDYRAIPARLTTYQSFSDSDHGNTGTSKLMMTGTGNVARVA